MACYWGMLCVNVPQVTVSRCVIHAVRGRWNISVASRNIDTLWRIFETLNTGRPERPSTQHTIEASLPGKER
jgi:hypothetical protein